MWWLLPLGVVGAVLYFSSQGKKQIESRTIAVDYDPNDPIGSWGKALEKGLPQHPDQPVLPPGEMTQQEHDFWVDFYKKKGHVIPPEYPSSPSDFGVGGDLDDMPSALRDTVVQALFEESEPPDLLSLSDQVELAGFPMAALRLRKKAIRLASA